MLKKLTSAGRGRENLSCARPAFAMAEARPESGLRRRSAATSYRSSRQWLVDLGPARRPLRPAESLTSLAKQTTDGAGQHWRLREIGPEQSRNAEPPLRGIPS